MSIDPNEIVRQRPTPATGAPVPIGGGPEMGTKFNQLLNQPPAGAQGAGTAPTASASDLMQRPVVQAPGTQEGLLQQATDTSNHMQNLTTMLQTPGLRMSKADQKLVVSKLSHANKTLRSAANSMGIDVGAPIKPTKNTSVLDKALLFLTDGQGKLNSVRSSLANLQMSGGGLNPADIIGLQVKINTADQQVQFCTATVGKLVDTVKTLMNIQV